QQGCVRLRGRSGADSEYPPLQKKAPHFVRSVGFSSSQGLPQAGPEIAAGLRKIILQTAFVLHLQIP
ncbi:MAG TPA: hypothetical protein DCX82_04955, partial [Lachnospiraceae bacterium]|nr:hypothetical protein [Lachnospiraceae bacterium]